MKIGNRTGERGNTMLVTLLTCVIIGFALASYLVLVSNQNLSVMRSLAWNSALPVVEAGVEEALTQINRRTTRKGLEYFGTDGWTLTSEYGGSYVKQRKIGDSYYVVYVTPTEPPVIYSSGFVPAPLNPAAQMGMMLAQITGGETYPTQEPPLPPGMEPPPNGGYPRLMHIKRSVRVNTKRDPLFPKVMVAKGKIDLAGNGVTTDSFNSTNAAYSSNGLYDPAKALDNGDVATNSELVNSLSVGNAKIKGHVSTGPGGSIAIGSNGSVGNKAWVEGGNKGVQPGYVSDDMNVQFPEVKVPFTSGYSTPAGGTVDGVNYTYILSSGDYKLSSFTGNVLVTGDARLWVTENATFSGNEAITIKAGGSLEMYVSAPTASLGGQGVLNETGSALNFAYYGLPSNTSLALGGNSAFVGTIYAPEASFQLGGGGKNTYDFIGASISKTVKMNGHFNFHYDEALNDLGPLNAYKVSAWHEVTASHEVAGSVEL